MWVNKGAVGIIPARAHVLRVNGVWLLSHWFWGVNQVILVRIIAESLDGRFVFLMRCLLGKWAHPINIDIFVAFFLLLIRVIFIWFLLCFRVKMRWLLKHIHIIAIFRLLLHTFRNILVCIVLEVLSHVWFLIVFGRIYKVVCIFQKLTSPLAKQRSSYCLIKMPLFLSLHNFFASRWNPWELALLDWILKTQRFSDWNGLVVGTFVERINFYVRL